MELPDDLNGTGFLDGVPMLREIQEDDWALIEHLASLCRQRGDIFTNGTVTAERARQLLEMPAAAVLSITTHLAILRRSDLAEALEIADADGTLTAEILSRREAADQRIAQMLHRERMQRAAAQAGVVRRARREERRWAEAQQDPAGTLERVRAIVHRKPSDQLRKRAALLGVPNASSRELPELELEVDERVAELERLAAGAADADPAERLRREAVAWKPTVTTLESIQRWERRRADNPDWRQTFRIPADFAAGPQSVVLISRATGVRVEMVAAHAAAVAEKAALQLRQVQEAWPDPAGLLADAVAATDWCWLAAAAGVAPDVVLAHARELLSPGGRSSP